ncbi:MAG: hypothetical protein M1825_002268 [Sarcosagium campestre]|nr:MAG: hypothetical protein M1825_002268 [Sarcosagium campestre]
MGGLSWWAGAGKTAIAVAALVIFLFLFFFRWVCGLHCVICAERFPVAFKRGRLRSQRSDGRGWGQDDRAPQPETELGELSEEGDA